MTIPLLIATSFSIGFFIESIIGFGGGIIAYAILGYFMDIKEMILSGLYIGTCSSAMILLSDYKRFSYKIYISTIPVCFAGTIFGVYGFTIFSSELLSVILGILLIILALKTSFFDHIKPPRYLKNLLLLIGGSSQGMFGIGGPFFVNALKPDFESKSHLRATIASFFVSFNIVRFFQLSYSNEIKPSFFFEIWWTVIPISLAIYLGFKVHAKINEDFFKKGIGIMTMISGIFFLL